MEFGVRRVFDYLQIVGPEVVAVRRIFDYLQISRRVRDEFPDDGKCGTLGYMTPLEFRQTLGRAA